ncbi:coatomer alpha subunit, putative, partial [Perkinsus marinus ATCC 50983]
SLYLANGGYLTVQNIDQARPQPGTTEITPQSTSLSSLRRPPNAMVSSLRSLMVNPFSSTDMNAIVMYVDQQGVGSYDLYSCTNAQLAQGLRDPLAPKEGAACNGACFVSRNRLAVLHRDNTIGLYNLNNELVKKFDPPVPKNQSNVEAIYQGGNNKVLLRSGEVVQLFDFNTRSVVGEITVAGGVRYVVWSKNMDYVAFLGKHNITLANGRNLELLHSLHENVRVKSG